jgi:hypothetical protein
MKASELLQYLWGCVAGNVKHITAMIAVLATLLEKRQEKRHVCTMTHSRPP